MAYMTSQGGSSTCVIELHSVPRPQPATLTPTVKRSRPTGVRTSSSLGQRERHAPDCKDLNESLPSPITAVERLQQWNHPKVNLYRTLAAFWSFIVMGANDAAYGALIPYLEEYYNLTYTVVALAFLSPVLGYSVSALLNSTIHLRFGQRGVAFISPICHILAYISLCLHPPYPALVVLLTLSGFGNGLEDAAWNAWIGNMANPNEVLGILHACYGLGATLSPFIATTMITKVDLPWYYFYYIMLGASGVELVTSAVSFWSADGTSYRQAHPRTTDTQGNRMQEALFKAPSARITWLCALFLLCYVGIEVALGGWIVTFMIRVRDGDPFASGMTATGFWLGLTIGRVILGFITPRLGETFAISIYLPIVMAFELVFWLVPQFYVSAVAVGLQGFFLGPMFPAAIVAAAKLLPRHLHVSAVGFAAALGGAGAAIFPFAVGAIAQSRGVQVLQPIVLALQAVLLAIWLGIPRISRKTE